MPKAKEGDLYGVVNAFGQTFEIYYGYYEAFEKESPYNDPVPVYPDLKKQPVFDGQGKPIVTAMQIACEAYEGKGSEDSCGHCLHFQKGEALFGLCKCKKRRKDVLETE
ncbi:MAG: hypothetical protein J6R40_04330 [Clostridia bacterium]|nr:hypothetical protein [Clostridia bacterium]